VWGRCAFLLAVLCVGPAHAGCAHAQLGPTCDWEEWIAVKEWRAQQLLPPPERHPAAATAEQKPLGWWTLGKGPLQFHICEVGGEEDDCFWVE
jgi:hypothetical protein